jgi:O-antigen/teichoic acid export membrane protein
VSLSPQPRSLGFYGREAARYLISIIASQAPLLMSPVVIRKLGYAEFGLVELALSSVGLLSICLSFGLHQLLAVRIFKDPDRRRLIAETLAIYILTAGPICLILLTPPAAEYLNTRWLGTSDAAVFRLAVVAALFTFFRHLMLSLTTMSYRSGLYMLMEISAALIYVLVILSAAAAHILSVRWVLYAQLMSLLPSTVAGASFALTMPGFLRELRKALTEIRRWADLLVDTLKSSIPFVGVGLVTQLNFVSDRFVLLRSGISTEVIGAYSISNRLAGVLPVLTTYLIGNLYSRELYGRCAAAASGSAGSIGFGMAYAVRTARLACGAMIPVLVCYYFAVAMLIGPVYDKPFASLIAFPGLLVAYGISVLTAFFMPLLIFATRTTQILLIIFFGTGLNILMNTVLIPVIGARACAVSLVSSNLFILVMVVLGGRKLIRQEAA